MSAAEVSGRATSILTNQASTWARMGKGIWVILPALYVDEDGNAQTPVLAPRFEDPGSA